MSHNKALIGAVLGGALAVATYTLFSTKTGKQLRRDITDNCEDFAETVHKFAVKLKENLSDNISEQAQDALKKMNSMKKELHFDNKDARHGLMAGALLGVLAAAAGTMFIRARSEEPSVLDNIANQACKWKSIIGDVLQALEKKPEAKCPSNRMHEVLDFAATGIQLWHNLQKRH